MSRPSRWLVTRFNQAPAILLMLATFLVVNKRQSPRRLAGWVAAFGLIAALPLIHNVHYGSTFVLMTTSATIPVNLDNNVLDAANQGQRLASVRDHLDGILYSGEYREGLDWVFRGLQMVYLVAIVVALTRGRHARLRLVLAMVPVAYLAVHLVYTVSVYYPRHIIAGHIAMGALVLLLGALTRSPQDTRPAG